MGNRTVRRFARELLGRFSNCPYENFSKQYFLQAGALNLGAGVAGGFKDKPLAQSLRLPENDAPFLVMPVGHKQ